MLERTGSSVHLHQPDREELGTCTTISSQRRGGKFIAVEDATAESPELQDLKISHASYPGKLTGAQSNLNNTNDSWVPNPFFCVLHR